MWTTCPDNGRTVDVAYAQEVARALSLPHRVFTPEDDHADYREYAQSVWGRLEHQTSYHAWLGPLTRTLHRQGLPVVDGLAGDVLVKGLYVSRPLLDIPSGPGRRRALLAALSIKGTSPLSEAARAWSADQVWADFDRVTDHLRRHSAEESLSVLVTRTARAIARSPFGLFGPELSIHVPFLAPQVIEAALSVDIERKLDGRFYRELLTAVSPRIATLPSTNDGRPAARTQALRQTAPDAMAWKHSVLSDLAVRVPGLIGADLRAALDRGPAALGRLSFPWLRGLTLFGLWLARHEGDLANELAVPWRS